MLFTLFCWPRGERTRPQVSLEAKQRTMFVHFNIKNRWVSLVWAVYVLSDSCLYSSKSCTYDHSKLRILHKVMYNSKYCILYHAGKYYKASLSAFVFEEKMQQVQLTRTGLRRVDLAIWSRIDMAVCFGSNSTRIQKWIVVLQMLWKK